MDYHRPTKIMILFYNSLLLCLTGFCGFYRYLPLGEKMYSTDIYYLYLTLLLMLINIYYVFQYKKCSFLKKNLRFSIIVIAILAMELIYSFRKYPLQGASETFKEAAYYFIFLLVLLSYNLINKKNSTPEYLRDLIIKYSLVCSIIAIIAFVAYTFFGINFLKLNVVFSYNNNNFRNGTVRFGVGTYIVIIGMLFSENRIIDKVADSKDYANIILGMLQIIVVGKTRMMILMVSAILVANLLLFYVKSKYIKVFGWMLVAVLVVAGFASASTLLHLIGTYFEADAGIMIRFKAIEYYIKQVKESPIWGTGFLSTSEQSSYITLLRGAEGRYFREDVGFIGTIHQFGVFAICALAFYIRFFLKKIKRNCSYSCALFSFFLFSLMTLVSLCILDTARLLYVSLLYILVDNQKDIECEGGN